MTFLVDANVLSEPTRRVPDGNVVRWLTEHEAHLVVDSIVLGEVCVGILALPAGRRRARLEKWLAEVVDVIECLPWDAVVCRRWADLVVWLRRKGHVMPLFDSMIAATALAHDLTVATRNVRDFQKAGVKVVDPFV